MKTSIQQSSPGSGTIDLAKVALYVVGPFDKANPTQDQLKEMKRVASDLGTSAFGTIILAFLHVHKGGTLYLNTVKCSEILAYLPEMLTAVKQAGNVKRILLSIGGYGVKDYQAIHQDIAGFQQQFLDLTTRVKQIDGFDLDLEETYEDTEKYDGFEQTLIKLVAWGASKKMTVTAAPYTQQSFWCKVLKETIPQNSRTSLFSWWNLQLYGGGESNTYKEWVDALQPSLENAESFIVPGYSVDETARQVVTPRDLSEKLMALRSTSTKLSGAFLWNYHSIPSTCRASDFANAIKTGLHGQVDGK